VVVRGPYNANRRPTRISSFPATPEPHGEFVIMNADGSNQQALTDNQYEEGIPRPASAGAGDEEPVSPNRPSQDRDG
jgi:hypothetical protein